MESKLSLPFCRVSLVGREMEYLNEAVRQGRLSSDGDFCRRCETLLSEMLGGAAILMTGSGTAALELAASVLELGPGDEVIMPSFTFVSTANAVCRLGAHPRFVDVRPDTMNMDETLVEAAINEKTKAIFPVHYAGVGCEPEAIISQSESHGLQVVEDSAQGIGARFNGKALGAFGAMAAFSFQDQKNISCGEGGALVVNDRRYLEKAHIVRDKGTNRKAFFDGAMSFYSWVDIGSAYALSDLAAAFLLGQLEKTVKITQERIAIYDQYMNSLAPLADDEMIELPTVPDRAEHNGHITFFFAQNRSLRDDLLGYLKAMGVPAVFHYVPLHSSPYGQRLGYTARDLPVTEELASRLIRLPMFLGMRTDQIEYVVAAIYDFFGMKRSH